MSRSSLVAVLGAAFILGACSSPSEDAPRAAPSTTQQSSPQPKGKAPKEPEEAPPENPAPEFSFETFEGDTLSLAELRGTPIVLNFWESW